jgi:lipoate-protein ligase B
MIGRLSGVLVQKAPPLVLLDVHGVGYEVDVPMGTFYNLPALGEAVVLLTHFVVREDAQVLFGFATEAEKQAAHVQEVVAAGGVVDSISPIAEALRRFRADLHWYVASIEEVVIQGLAAASGGATRAFRLPGSPGVWVGPRGLERKVAAVGMNSSKWFTQHGLAVNVCPDLAHFAHIVPCGIRDRAVTSLAAEAAARGEPPPALAHVKAHVLAAFSEVFNCDLVAQAGVPVQPEGRAEHWQ